jgi:hypothetical protein
LPSQWLERHISWKILFNEAGFTDDEIGDEQLCAELINQTKIFLKNLGGEKKKE